MIDIDEVAVKYTYPRFLGWMRDAKQTFLLDIPEAKNGKISHSDAIPIYAGLGWLWFTLGIFIEILYCVGFVAAGKNELLGNPRIIALMLFLWALPAGKVAAHCMEYYRVVRQLRRGVRSKYYKPTGRQPALALTVSATFILIAGLLCI